MYLLDTDVLLNLMSRLPSTSLVARLAMVSPDRQFTSSVSYGEVVYGAYKLGGSTDKLLGDMEERMLPNLTVLDFDTAAARRYGILREYLQRVGIRVTDTDARIAAIAITHGLTLITSSPSRFSGVPGLRAESWIEDEVAV
ncbi:MAG: PIN domain-containing protein [Chloroflexi bacterium]|nr:PIN domain-containing protein [Chloroflexota bacterium]MDA1228317.1 PIN domain-containing protein [Chloroflexota bacterium]